MPPSKVAVLINAAAGAVMGQGKATLRERISAAFDHHGMLAVPELLSGTDLHKAAERALQGVQTKEFDAVVVGGGDGSIRTVASVLAGSGVVLGILPLGTRNHFARDLGIPADLDAAVAVIAGGHTHPVDVGDVNGETFINNSSIGVYPYLVLDRERRRRRHGLSKWFAMMVACLRVVRHLPVGKLSICVGGWTEPCRSPCVLVGNNVYDVAVPAFGRRERLDGGELCLYIAKTQGRLSLLWLALRTILGRLDHPRELRILKVRTAEIRSRQRRLLVALDGEVVVLRPPLRFRIRSGALHVFSAANGRAAA
jgi:diacylglycerol kinase family enzyme